MKTAILLAAAAALVVGHPAQAAPMESTSATTTYHRMTVGGVSVFYREAGPKDAPTIVLLHGFPSSSREFDTLIPLLATRYHLIAPDFPGFGQSDPPPPSSYAGTSNQCPLYPQMTLELSRVMSALCQKRTFKQSIQDRGEIAPLRLVVLAHRH